MGLTFTWDPFKAERNLKKHGVSFVEATAVFGDPLSVTISDPDHSGPGDNRQITLGRSTRNRYLVVVFIEEGDEIHLISARLSTPRERRDYEQTDR